MHKSKLPWLKLDIKIPHEEMLSEAKALEDRYVGHRTAEGSGAYSHKGWKSLCIHGISATKTNHFLNYGYKSNSETPYKWTEVSDLCPVTTDFFKNKFPYSKYFRLRFMLLEPGGYITPHKDTDTNRLSPINIALNHPEGCKMKMRGHKGMVIWFTGLSGSGKSTLANAVNEVLHLDGLSTYVLDGDNIRHGLCKDLGFSDKDREENIRRIGEVANLFMNAGIITITAFVSPFISDRNKVREIIGSKDFVEVYCAANIDVCESRDTKGLYKKARLGEIKEFTGISSPYEVPENPEIVVDTGSLDLNNSVEIVMNYLREQNLIKRI